MKYADKIKQLEAKLDKLDKESAQLALLMVNMTKLVLQLTDNYTNLGIAVSLLQKSMNNNSKITAECLGIEINKHEVTFGDEPHDKI